MKKNMIFTVCTGRCGQASIVKYVNKFSTNSLAELEPPETFFEGKNLFTHFLKNFERKFIFTDKELGRGDLLKYYDDDLNIPIKSICEKKKIYINKILKKKKNYFELSKFFIRSYCEEIIKINPNINILYLFRNPITNAISFLNRNKNFAKDNFLPNFNKSIFKIEDRNLNLFEKYLWCWIEIKLRLKFLKKKYNLKKIYYFRTEDIDNTEKLSDMFRYFEIKHRNLHKLQNENSNVNSGFGKTIVKQTDIDNFFKFIKKIPKNIIKEIPEFINSYKEIKLEKNA